MRRPTAILAMAVFVATAATGMTHTLPRERTVLVEMKRDAVDAMVVFQEPPGKAVQFLVGRFDFDDDDELTGAEAKAAAEEWAPRALQGLTFRVDGEALEAEPESVKFKREHNGALSCAVLLSWGLDSLVPDATRRVSLERAPDAADFTTLLRFQHAPDLTFTSTPGDAAATDAPTVGPYHLRPGRRLGVELESTDESSPRPELPTARP